MNWSQVGRWVVLAGSLVIGLGAGMAGKAIFNAKVPAAMRTGMTATEAAVYYIGAGVVLGLVIFAWAMLAAWLAGRSAAGKARRQGAGT